MDQSGNGNSIISSGIFNHNVGKYLSIQENSVKDRDGFWSEHAKIIDWYSTWTKVLDDGEKPFYKWFKDGKLNVSYNCVDRHLKNHRRNKAAYIWIGENGEERIVTYQGLYRRVNAFARTLLDSGLGKGDCITIYMPMIIETVVAMLAAARIGVVFTLVFSGFGSDSLAERIRDSGSKLLLTADGGFRNGKIVDLKKIADEALDKAPDVETVIVYKRTGHEIDMKEGRDFWWDKIVKDDFVVVAPEVMDSSDPLYILYTSGTTGKPKGVVHGSGGYSVWVANTLKWAFDPGEDDRWWCAADIGWVTGHSYIVFAPLLLGLTSILYEGSILYPDPSRMWQIVERYGVNQLYTSPTAIRSLMRHGNHYPDAYDLSSLKVLGTVGEPINPAAWEWFYKVIGKGKCPIVDTYWQTETGGFIISPSVNLGLPNLKPGSATFPMPSVEPYVLSEDGLRTREGEKGFLCVKGTWPGMMLTINNDPARYKEVYFSRFPGYYYSGDYAIQDEEGYFWLLGRADEVLKVSGHRLGTIEIEDALVSVDGIAEAAVFGKPDTVKGDAIVAFVVLREGHHKNPDFVTQTKKVIRESLGPITVPDEIHVVNNLPKTRSGKIMRRVLKAIYLNQVPGDVSTLESGATVDEIKEAMELFRKQNRDLL